DYLLIHKIPGTNCTMSPEDLEIIKKYYAMGVPARNLINLMMDLVRDYESKIPNSPRITVSSGTSDKADNSEYLQIASRDGGGIRKESVTPEQIRMLQGLEPLDDDL
ncbi:MAG: hypothetical protein K2H82_10640, partial [Oscillospiraceae bacterium]|nr:hypothetical protein [Oscillospiraceae bacterium]